MILANSQVETIHQLLEDRRRDASTERLLRDRPHRTPARHLIAALLRRMADAVEPRTLHRHHPHLPS